MAKPEFFKFKEINSENVHREFQVHTVWTDGRNSVAEILEEAEKRQIKELAFTEHARAGSNYCPEFFRQIEFASQSHPAIRVYKGLEVKIVDTTGALDISPAMRDAADLVIASVHSFAGDHGQRKNPGAVEKEEAHRIEFSMAMALVESRKADVLSHAGGMSLRHFGEFPLSYFEQLLAKCAQNEVPFEINFSYHADILEDLLPLLDAINPLISIGSDVHELQKVGACRDALVRQLGL